MRLAHEQINADLVDMELIELKFIFERCRFSILGLINLAQCNPETVHHDNRDFDIIPNYQPRSQSSFNEQTLPFCNTPSVVFSCSCFHPRN